MDITHASLRHVASCDDLTVALRDDARSKMNRRIDAEIRAIRQGWGYGYASNSSFGAGAAAPQGAATNSGASGAAVPAAAPAHSDTETQVKGVDEADIVKTDGNRIYLLHGSQFIVLDSWPATSLGTESSTMIEGDPLEMFVADGRAVIFSRVDGTPIYAAAQVTPRPAYSDGYSPGYYGQGGNMAVGAPAVPGGAYVGGPSYANALTKVTVLALDGARTSVTRELYFEGDYTSSRRIASKVRIVLGGGAHGPQLEYSPQVASSASPPSTYVGTVGSTGQTQPSSPSVDAQIAAWEQVRAKNAAIIAKTTFADWVPVSFTKDGGAIAAAPTRCEDYYVPTTGTAEFGFTQVAAINLDAPTDAPRSASIVGSVSTVYGNADTMVLAGPAYMDPWTLRSAYAYQTAGTSVDPKLIPVETLDYTHLHVFDFTADPTTPQYTGTGTVPGTVSDQFAIDEKNGVVRVATTEQRSGPPAPNGASNEVSHVYALENAQGHFAISGDAGEIAPGEQLYSTRFVGDKAYVVTWHVTDPLFVVDVADSKNVRVLGQVQIPGFSTYIHPLDDTHLLTIGRETDMTGHQHAGSYWYGIALQIFDVTNPLAPALQHKFVFDGGEYATSEAMTEHKAFTYFDDRKLLAFPYVHNGSYGSYAQSSTLQVFQVGVAEGINPIGAVDHSPILSTMPNGSYGYCGGYFDGAVRRGVFVENTVFSISYGGVIASDVSALATPVATLKLAAPTMSGVCN